MQPCQNEHNEHLLPVTESLNTAISEGIKIILLQETQVVGSERSSLSWVPRCSRAEASTTASLCGHEALRDAAKVKETQSDLLTNCWPYKFIYLRDLFLRSH